MTAQLFRLYVTIDVGLQFHIIEYFKQNFYSVDSI